MNTYIPSIIRVLVCLMSLLASTGCLRAQPVHFPQPELITDRQGLPQAFVPAILQDKQGFIWAATRDGLCRYDGYRFKVFQPDPDGRPSLSFAGLNQIELDKHGRIWIASERGEIDVFDPRTETFTNFSRLDAFRRLVKPGTTYYGLYIDRQDRLWLTVIGYGVVCWDINKKQGTWFRHQPQQVASISADSVYNVAEGADGRIWLATTKGLDQFEEATLRFKHLRHQPGNPQSLPEDFLTRVCLRPTGELILFSQHYLTLLKPGTGQLRSYRLPAQGDEWLGHKVAIDRTGTVYFDQNNILFRFTEQEGVQIATRWNQHNEGCSSLLIDRTNVLWVGTAGAGIRTYDLQPNPFRKRRYHRGFYQDLLANDSLSLDLPPVSRSAQATLSGLSSYNFRSTFDATGRFWFNVGTLTMYRLDGKTNKTAYFPLPTRTVRNKSGDVPCPMATDSQGRIWAVYGSDAFWFDEQTGLWTRFPFPIPYQPGNAIMEFVADNQALWLASQAGGLWRIDRRTGQRQQFVNHPKDQGSLSSNILYCLSADPADSNRLWIGTFGNGLCLFDKRTGRFRRFAQADGLPNNVIYSAIPDPYGYVWIGTNKGLCRMNRRTFTTQTFTHDDGIMADEFNRYHYVLFPKRGTADGKILLGGLEGFTFFSPQRIGQDAFEPAVELTELQVDKQIIQPEIPYADGTDSATSANRSVLGILPIQATDQLTLHYNQNYLTVRFAALQFNRPAKNRYRYRLEGLEETWTETVRPEAIYTNLPPGDYTLVVNASNTSGRWSRHVRKLALTIQPPFWASWWAIILYSLLGLGIAWGLLQIYLNRIRLNQTIRLRQQEADQLRAVDTIKTNFFTNITHEFRTPLTLILAPTEQMASENPDPKNQRRLQTIEQNAHQLLGLINQLLDLSKLEASVMPIHESRGNLTEFISHWLNPLTDQALTQGIRLLFTSEVTGDYWFDAEKLERIVYNLTANALKFTKAGTITVSLTDVSGRIRLTVADTGVGISAQHLPHIFDRFYQVGDTNATPGTGIGLALVQELVQLQGGQISVESEPGQGTTFVVELPYRPVDASEAAPDGIFRWNREAGTDAWTDTDESDEPRLLVVEDNDELARFIAESLPQNYRIRRAVNGRDGLEQALEHVPDLIISDVMMPLMDGFTLCSQLKTDLRTSHIPIILLTAKSSVENRLAGLSLGADDYLTKPFQLTELQLRVRNQLVSKQRQREWVQASLNNPGPASTATPAEPADPFLTRLYALFEANLGDSGFGLEQIMNELGMSRTNLFRKVKALAGLTAHELLRNYRLKQAAHLLRTGVSVSETAYQVGFESPAYFSKCFRELYQMSPSEFVNQG
ncbi:hybrid sensor histidine kinase/response regulator transcription factor [Larkinella punicea]|uniref:histidine kinase n=1 Tax=Larkinella punicea TaxID=2315727 RepID=A0A368JGX2_9BACT|nr:ATP-binding protein [Larkinella punicea]RCR66918.1 response regulator [Larkinella punicea]